MNNLFLRLSTEILNEDFRSTEDRNLHILALVYITKYAHNTTGEFWISTTELAKNLNVKRIKAIRLLESLEKRGYIKKIGKTKVGNKYFPTYIIILYENQQKSEQVNEQVNEHKTNTEITNTDITNTEIYSKSVSESESERTPKTKPHNFEKLENKADTPKNKKQLSTREDFAGQKAAYKITPEEVVELWNAIISPKTKKPLSMSQLTSKELRYLRAACKVHDREDWINYFERLRESEILWNFESGWKPNIGWALNYDNWGKVVRGDYIPDRPETVGKTKAELIREQNLEAVQKYAERINQGVSVWDLIDFEE